MKPTLVVSNIEKLYFKLKEKENLFPPALELEKWPFFLMFNSKNSLFSYPQTGRLSVEKNVQQLHDRL